LKKIIIIFLSVILISIIILQLFGYFLSWQYKKDPKGFSDSSLKFINKSLEIEYEVKGDKEAVFRLKLNDFKRYLVVDKDWDNAKKILDELKERAPQIEGGGFYGIYIGNMLQHFGYYDEEFEVYDIFVKNYDNGNYHYRRSTSFEKRGDKVNQLKELLKAKEYKVNEVLLKKIDKKIEELN